MGSRSACPASRSPRRCSACSACRLSPGAAFAPKTSAQGLRRVVVLAEALWRRRFGGDAAIVGQSVTLNGERHQIVGVVPHAFRDVGRSQIASTASPQMFFPLTIDPARENRGNHVVRVVGRLRPGVSLDRARDEMRRIAAALEQEFPATNKDWSVRLETLYDTMLDERVRPSLLVLLAAVGMVLLIACANVANVLLARGISRQREFALRTALGAGRSRLVRQLVTESVCLAVVSGACGLAARGLRGQAPAGHAAAHAAADRRDQRGCDRARCSACSLSLASGLFMGLVPAVRASRVALTPSLAQQRQGGRRSLGHVRATRHRRGADGARDHAARGGGAASAEFRSVAAGPPRVRTRRRDHRADLAARRRYPDAARMWAFWGRLLESLDGMPQIQSVAARNHGAIRARCARRRQGATRSASLLRRRSPRKRGSGPWSTW